jgi:ParB-like nuclease family protein
MPKSPKPPTPPVPATVPQRYAVTDLDRVRPHPKNPRQGDVGMISQSIDKNGFYGGLIVQEKTGLILAGNHRWRAAKQAGLTQLPMIFVDVDDATALRILLADNRANDLASYDTAGLAAVLQELGVEAMAGTGYDGDDLDKLLRDLAGTDPFADLVEGQRLGMAAGFEVSVRVRSVEQRDEALRRLTEAGLTPSVKVVRFET